MKFAKKLLVSMLAVGLMTGCSSKGAENNDAEIVTEITSPVEITGNFEKFGMQCKELKKNL